MRVLFQRGAAAVYDFLKRQARFRDFTDHLRTGTLEIGPHTYGTPDVLVFVGSEAKVSIGAYCSLATGVTFITGGIHPVDWISTYPFRARWALPGAFRDGMPATKGNIEVGSDVWFGTDAMVLPGLSIGHGAVVAARAVVTRDVPPYAIVAGVPARTIGMRFDEATVQALLRIRWWEWEEGRVRECVDLLSSPDVSEFLRVHGEGRAQLTPAQGTDAARNE